MIDQGHVHVVCFGNMWQGDDGFGLHVLQQLREQRCLPPHVRTFDAGTAGLNALPLFEGCTKAVLVDAVKTGATIGQLHRLSLDNCAPSSDQLGLHGAGVEHLLAALPAAFGDDPIPELVMIGAEVGQIAPFTTALSPPVAAAMAEAVQLVTLECTNQAGGPPDPAPVSGEVGRKDRGTVALDASDRATAAEGAIGLRRAIHAQEPQGGP